MGHSPSAGCWALAPAPAHARTIVMPTVPNARRMLMCFPEKTVTVFECKK
jgi:hypothetical protein